ncbi:hypothetical protein E2C01_054012 [Portunus trituberculatus]|uniref:Uncharacterized protein n=1 Tax=Portunus trituberculatus TaxID=210409 RepID=A0A5B7GQX0_PORTR|nr:hypothetical protein [Portunus trituberculatus]
MRRLTNRNRQLQVSQRSKKQTEPIRGRMGCLVTPPLLQRTGMDNAPPTRLNILCMGRLCYVLGDRTDEGWWSVAGPWVLGGGGGKGGWAVRHGKGGKGRGEPDYQCNLRSKQRHFTSR